MAFPKGFRLKAGYYYRLGDRSGPYVIDAAGQARLVGGNGTVVVAPMVLASAPNPAGNVGQAYRFQPITVSGTSPIVFAIASGSLPAGLSLNTSTGLISGVPTTAGTSTFTLRATDANNQIDNLGPFQIRVGATGSALALYGDPVLTGTVGVSYSFQLGASGGVQPYTFAVASGTLPSGISLNASTGLVSGTPTAAATSSNIVLRVNDAAGETVSLAPFSVTIAVAPATLTISGTPPTTATVGTAYSFTPTAAGGVTPRTFALIAGTLPAGLSFNTGTGAITGTPTEAGSATGLSIRVTDNVGTTATLATFGITVSAGATVPGQPAAPTATAGDGTVSLAFSAPSTGGSPILEYQAELSNSNTVYGSASPIAVPSANGAAVTGRVRARNAIGWGPYSPASNAVTPQASNVSLDRVGILGDSITLRYWSAWNPVTVTSSGGVATVTHAIPAAQQPMPGQKIKMYNPGSNRPIMGEFTILARTSATTFTYAYTGTDDVSNFSCSLAITNGYTDQSYFTYLQGLCNQRLNLVANGGVGGETSTQILARTDAFLAAQALDLIIVNCGANDLVQGVASATINANWTSIIQKCAAAASKVIVITTAPIQAQGGATAKLVHDHVVTQAAGYSNVSVADAFTICADPASGTSYTPKANYLHDGVHWGQRMALEVAQAIKPLIESQLPAAVGPQGANLLTNGDFSGTPVSGVAPNWTVTATGMPTSTRTVESSADGNLQQVVCATSGAQTCLIEADTEHTKVTAGKRYRVWMRVKGSGLTAMNTVGGGLNLTAGGVTHTMRFMMANPDGTTQTPFVDFDLYLRTETFLCPASVTALRVRCAFVWTGAGGGTVAVGKAFLEEMP